MNINFSDVLRFASVKYPERIAVIDDDGKEITYRTLNSRVNALANAFINLGLNKGDKLVFIVKNRLEAIEIHFAAAKSGIMSVPLNHNLHSAELALLIKHCEPRALIVESNCYDKIINCINDIEKIMIINPERGFPNRIDYEKLIASHPRLEPRISVNSRDCCSILYTSGTTGDPKGAIRTHANNYWAAINMALSHNYIKTDRELYILPIWSIGFYNILCPNFIKGGTVYLHEGFMPERILKDIEKNKITRLYLVPAMWNQIFCDPAVTKYDLSSLKQVFVGSGPSSLELKWQMREMFSENAIVEIWGMTEGGLISIDKEDNFKKLGSIGQPICFNYARIVDDYGVNVANGCVGELIISGPAVIPGYFKLEEAKETFFLGKHWFKTGDLARQDNDGYYYIAGRKSDMIIFGDNKVYPIEIEKVLLSHKSVQDAVVLGIPDPLWSEIVTAAVIPQKGAKLAVEELKSFVGRYLAKYKIPTHIYIEDSFPVADTGKIIRHEVKRIIKNKLRK